MTAAPEGAQHIRALTGLRGYAALWVVVSHLSYTDFLSLPLGLKLAWQYGDGLIRHEYLGVDLFFMLSGFVLTHVHRREFDDGVHRGDVGRFLLLRLGRIYPLHLAALALTVLAVQFVPGGPIDGPAGFLLQLLLMASWGELPGNTWNLPSWSLSSEWLAYLVFPLIAMATAALRRVWWLLVAVALLLGLFWVLMFRLPFGIDSLNGAGASTRVLVGVCLGSVLRRLFDWPAARRLPWRALFVMSLPLVARSMVDVGAHRVDNNLFAYGSMAFLLFAAASFRQPFLPLTGRVPFYLGEISFAVYILHYPVLRTLRWLFDDFITAAAANGTQADARLVTLGALLVVVGVSAAAHHAIERPARRWARTWIDRRWPSTRLAG